MVEVPLPLRQGLKLGFFKISHLVSPVEVPLPLRQGLKHYPQKEENRNTGEVEVPLPLRQGLKHQNPPGCLGDK